MPILDDIIDHPVLGPRIRRAEEKALERGLRQGLEQGLEQGREEGRHHGELAVLLRQVEKRFGSVPPQLRDRLEKMAASEVEAVALRLLDARSIDEL